MRTDDIVIVTVGAQSEYKAIIYNYSRLVIYFSKKYKTGTIRRIKKDTMLYIVNDYIILILREDGKMTIHKLDPL